MIAQLVATNVTYIQLLCLVEIKQVGYNYCHAVTSVQFDIPSCLLTSKINFNNCHLVLPKEQERKNLSILNRFFDTLACVFYCNHTHFKFIGIFPNVACN
jgi:hypothetical protein